MHNCILTAFQSFIGLCNNMFSGLCQHLNGNISRDQVIVYEMSAEIIVCI